MQPTEALELEKTLPTLVHPFLVIDDRKYFSRAYHQMISIKSAHVGVSILI